MLLAEGSDPHLKLHHLLELTPTTGKFWYRLDMTAEHHAATVRDWWQHAPLSFRAQTAAHGRAGLHTTFDAQLACAQQQWPFVEPCMHKPLMITPLGSDTHLHFKQPPPQGWSCGCYTAAALKLSSKETAHVRGRWQQAGLEKERVRDVRDHLAALLDGVTMGSEQLYDSLSTSSLDGQALALVIDAHLGRPAIPPPSELLRGLCAAASLHMERATDSLHVVITDLRLQANTIGKVVEHSQAYWHVMSRACPRAAAHRSLLPAGGGNELSASTKVVGLPW